MSRLLACLVIGLALGPQSVPAPQPAHEARVREEDKALGPQSAPAPQPADEARVREEAKAAFAQGAAEAARGTGESRRAAIDAYQRARALWQSIGDQTEEANALNRIGLMQMQLSNLAEALAAHTDALRIRRAIGDRRGEGVSLNNLAAIHMRRGDYEQAQALYAEALPSRREMGDRVGEAYSLIGLALSQSIRTSAWQTALPHFHRAHELFVEAKNAPGEAEALYYLGYAHKNLDAYDEAMPYFDRALALRREERDLAGQASVLNQVVAIHLQLGDPTTALELIDDVLALRRQSGDRRGEAYTLQTAGMAAIDLRDHGAALAHLAEALRIFETIGDREGQSSAWAYMARVHLATNDPTRALDLGTRAQQVLEGRSTLAVTTVLSTKGEAQAALGLRDEADATYTQALAEARRLGQTLGAAKALTGLGRVARDRGDLLASRERLLDALAAIESVRAAVAQPDQRASFLGLTQDAYESAIETLMALDRQDSPSGGRYAAEALAVSERRRARTLVEMLAQARANVGTPSEQPTPATLDLAGIQRLLDRDTVLLEYSLGERRSYVWAVTSDALAVHELPDRVRIETAAREAHRLVIESTRRVVRAPMQRAVDELGTLLLQPIAREIGAKRLVIVADGALQYVPFAALPEPKPSRGARTPGVDGTRDASGSLSAAEATSPPPAANRARLAPAERVAAEATSPPPAANRARLAPAERVFDAPPLIVRHEIVMLPSASTLDQLRRPTPDRPVARKAVAVFADPVLQPDDPRFIAASASRAAEATTSRDVVRAAEGVGVKRFERLPYTHDEAMVIAAKAGPGASLTATGFDATRELALSPALADYRIVHFATHTALDAHRPERSGIVLTLVDRDRHAIDGFLRLHDIFTLRLSTDVVVLSACQTALGKDIRGEGLIGLTRGFMHAGASQIVASLWNIRDRATSRLMARFYAGLLERGLTPAAALREAQVSMWKTPAWRMPAYWAGFVVQGDWGGSPARDRDAGTGQSSSSSSSSPARFRGPKAELTPTIVTTSPIRAGNRVRLAVKVRLPEKIHVQSDKPREKAYIPTVLTVDAPAGVRVEKIGYPPASDLTQEGLDQPLAVFEREFTITVDVRLAKEAHAGDIIVPARLRYQACDDRVCYPPATVDTRWTLRVTR